MYILIDKDTNQYILDLPDHLSEYSDDLYRDINEDFAFEPINEKSLKVINEYIIKWFLDKGISLNNGEQT